MRSSSWTTIEASSMSWCSRASSVRSNVVTTRSMPPRAWTSSAWSSSWKCWRPGIRRRPFPGRVSAETAADIVLGLLLRRVGEDLLRRVDLHEAAGLAGPLDVEERRQVAGARGLLHIVRHDHDRVLLFQLEDQVLDGQSGDRVQCRGGLVHQQHVGLDGRRAGDAEALLLAAGEAHAWLAEAVLDLFPEVRAAQGALDDVVHVGLLDLAIVELQAGRDVVVDRHRGER